MVKVTLVTIKKIALDAYIEQLKAFFGNNAVIAGYAIEDDPAEIQGDVVLVTSYFLLQTVKRKLVKKNAEIIHVSNAFSREQIGRIKKIPANSKVLVVNSTKEMAHDCISQFEHGVTTPLRYIAYSETEDKNLNPADYMYAITFIETFFQKNKVEHVVELGSRKIHPYVYEHMIDSFFTDNEEMLERLAAYRAKMFPMNYSLIELENVGKEWEEILNNIIYMMNKGAIVLDDDNRIKGINDYACEKLQVNHFALYGKNIDQEPRLNQMYTRIDKLGENTETQLYLDGLDMEVIISKRVIQFYSYRFMTIVLFEEAMTNAEEITGKMKSKFTFDDIVGESNAIRRVVEIAKQISFSDNPVLLTGETGTGKELFAHSIHNRSQRSGKPFIAMNCAAFPENLLESELFGYEPGTFTGALKNGKKGIFELANGGTVFLDEIGDAPLSIQAKLLRVLQEKEIRRIGGEENIHVDVRIISATNRNLRDFIESDLFRKDLFYRLNTFTINIPPLRERKDDIEGLVGRFLEDGKYGYKKVLPEVAEILKSQRWEGNIRELKNCVDYMAFMSGDYIGEDSMPEEYKSGVRAERSGSESGVLAGISAGDREAIGFIAKTLYYDSVGRDKLLALAEEKNIKLTEYHIKRILKIMEQNGFIEMKKGRGGILLTEKGSGLL